MTESEKEKLAEMFHDTYERLAPSYGYETRLDTRRFDPDTPNGKLMMAVCGEVGERLARSEYAAGFEDCRKQAVEIANKKALECLHHKQQYEKQKDDANAMSAHNEAYIASNLASRISTLQPNPENTK